MTEANRAAKLRRAIRLRLAGSMVVEGQTTKPAGPAPAPMSDRTVMRHWIALRVFYAAGPDGDHVVRAERRNELTADGDLTRLDRAVATVNSPRRADQVERRRETIGQPKHSAQGFEQFQGKSVAGDGEIDH